MTIQDIAAEIPDASIHSSEVLNSWCQLLSQAYYQQVCTVQALTVKGNYGAKNG